MKTADIWKTFLEYLLEIVIRDRNHSKYNIERRLENFTHSTACCPVVVHLIIINFYCVRLQKIYKHTHTKSNFFCDDEEKKRALLNICLPKTG